MSAEICHLYLPRKWSEIEVGEQEVRPGLTIPLLRLPPFRAIVSCDFEDERGTVLTPDTKNLVVRIHESWDDEVGSIVKPRRDILSVSFHGEQYVTLYKNEKKVRRSIELYHRLDDDEEGRDRQHFIQPPIGDRSLM